MRDLQFEVIKHSLLLLKPQSKVKVETIAKSQSPSTQVLSLLKGGGVSETPSIELAIWSEKASRLAKENSGVSR